MQITTYEQGAIEEIKRVAALFSGNFNQKQYYRSAKKIYSRAAIQWKLKMPLNELKRRAGLTIKEPTRGRKPKDDIKGIKRGNTTRRHCNMSDCGNPFDAVGHMRSCPACTNLKNKGGVD